MIILNFLIVILLLVATHSACKLYLIVRQRSAMWLMIACGYATLCRALSIAAAEGLLDIPTRELAIPAYVLFALGVIGLYRAVKKL